MLKIIFYSIGSLYIFLGLFFFDWTTHGGHLSFRDLASEDILSLVVDLTLILLGFLICLATFNSSKRNKLSSVVYNVTFWVPLAGLITLTSFLTYRVVDEQISVDYLTSSLMWWVIFLPTAIVYINKGQLSTGSHSE